MLGAAQLSWYCADLQAIRQARVQIAGTGIPGRIFLLGEEIMKKMLRVLGE
jgi:hypothetical protein